MTMDRRLFLLGGLALPAGARPAGAVPEQEREVTVHDGRQLAAALAAALPGDRIVLAGGAYAGDFAASRPGAPGTPVTVEASTLLGAVVTGRFVVRAADVILRGLVVRKGVELGGDRARVERCRVDDCGAASAVELAGGAGAVVEFCELTNFASQAVRVAGAARAPLVRRNWIHDQAPPPDPLDVAAVICGTGKATSATRIGARVVENVVERIRARQAIELKSSGNVVEGNTALGNARWPADVLVRHGTDNVFLRNWVEDGRLLLVDERSLAVGNRCAGSRHGPCLGVMAGTLTGDDQRRGRKGYPISEDARVVANEAVVDVGWRYAGYGRRPLRTRIEAHDRARWPVRETFVDPGQVAYAAATDLGPMPAPPRRLTPAEVGPFAAG
jgi:nitrous oxidase accessory protein NosD